MKYQIKADIETVMCLWFCVGQQDVTQMHKPATTVKTFKAQRGRLSNYC